MTRVMARPAAAAALAGAVLALAAASGMTAAHAATTDGPAPAALTLTAQPQREGDHVRFGAEIVGMAGQVPAVTVTTATGSALQATAAVTGTGTGDGAAVHTAVLVVDTSGSMAGDGISAARDAALRYAGALAPTTRVGLVAFSSKPAVLTQPTTDRAALQSGVAQLSARGETALYDAVVAASSLAGPQGNLVILSDGRDTVSSAGLDQALGAVTAAGQRVDAVGFNTTDSDTATLARIAAAGHGEVRRAADAASLGQAFAAAAATVPLGVSVDVVSRATDPLPVTVTLVSGTRTYTGSTVLPAAPKPAAAEPALAVVRVPVTHPGTLTWVLAGAIVVLFALAMGGVLWPRSAESAHQRRLRAAIASYAAAPVPLPAAEPGLAPAGGAVTWAANGVLGVTERVVGEGERQGRIALSLDRAGVAMLPHEWLIVSAGVTLGSGAALFLLIHPRPLGLLLGLLAGWGGTTLWLRRRQSRRSRAFAGQLPDTLQLIAGSLRSGFSLQQALASAQEGGPQPMAGELGRALAAARIGVPLEDELDQIAVRMRSEDWRMAVMAIRIQRSVGGNLAEVLSTTSKTLREREAVTRQVHALSAEGRLSAYVLMALPIGVGGFLFLFRRAYLEPLWTTLPGLAMLAVAVIGMAVGTFWMLATAKVEV